MLLSQELRDLIGTEHDLDTISRKLRRHVEALEPPVVGAFQISCADESERECVESFHQIFVRELLPELKYWSRSSFRIATLGGRYEQGAIAIAEEHFATPKSMDSFKVLMVKINGHVSVVDDDDTPRYGFMPRYDRESVYCGAIHATLDGGSLPFVTEMTELFGSNGLDRLSTLRAMESDTRSLAAAMSSVQLQAARVVSDIANVKQHSPTLYLIAGCVTLNRLDRDTELVCSLCAADYRPETPVIEHIALGDDPSRYRIDYKAGKLAIGVK